MILFIPRFGFWKSYSRGGFNIDFEQLYCYDFDVFEYSWFLITIDKVLMRYYV